MKKIFSPILKLAFILLLASCQPEEVNINTGPLFPGPFMVEGTNTNSGEPVSKELGPNESGVPVDAVITVTFSKPVDPGTVTVSLMKDDGTAIDHSATVNGESITIAPAANLEFSTKYTLTIGDDIKGTDGGLLTGDLSRTFTTEGLAPTIYDGRIFYMSFDGNFTESVSGTNATVVGTPGFAGEGIKGDAYAGAADSYLTFPAAGLQSEQFSAAFWLKVNATPDRAGVLVIGPPDPNLPATPNNRTSGFRFFREAAGTDQRFKLNVGNGTADNWFDGGEAADVDPTTSEWVHFAFTISDTESKVYINGDVVSEGTFPGISWTGTDILSIMSGAPRFMEWGHLSDLSLMDELNMFNKVLSEQEVEAIMVAESSPEGQTFFMPFEGAYTDVMSGTEATVVGTPGFAAEAVNGTEAYEGAADSYLTFPAAELQGEEFSASFWLKINAVPDRAGILVMGPPDPNLPATPNNRTSGFRFFREAAGADQRFKLNVGNGTADAWFDGGEAADVDPAANEWVHFAFTISPTEAIVYIDGEVVSQGALEGGISWEGVDVLSIMSGAPRFMEWGHLSDLSYMDDLRLFNRVLSVEEVQDLAVE